jgi:hypothetical protein
MATVRGQFIPRRENAGSTKRYLDVLLWLPSLNSTDIVTLNDLEILATYLGSISPSPCCQIRLWIAPGFEATQVALEDFGIECMVSPSVSPGVDNRTARVFADSVPEEVLAIAATARAVDADLILLSATNELFMYVLDFDKELNTWLVDSDLLQRGCEIFVRGYDIPWAFENKFLSMPWTGFYQFAEPQTFKPALKFYSFCQQNGASKGALEAVRSFVFNRLSNICFTRDRLLFFSIQQAAGKRAGWTNQGFEFEISYHLNFYYLLLYGGFDHLSIIVNAILQLGLPDRRVGAKYESFKRRLQKMAPDICALFEAPETAQFIDRLGDLRHYAAHRGSIAPGTLFEQPEAEPTEEELDADISEAGLDSALDLIPPGPDRDQMREVLRTNARVARYKKIQDCLVLIEREDGSGYFVRPMSDIGYNFWKFYSFMIKVLEACQSNMTNR